MPPGRVGMSKVEYLAAASRTLTAKIKVKKIIIKPGKIQVDFQIIQKPGYPTHVAIDIVKKEGKFNALRGVFKSTRIQSKNVSIKILGTDANRFYNMLKNNKKHTIAVYFMKAGSPTPAIPIILLKIPPIK